MPVSLAPSESSKSNVVATYVYTDRFGEPVYRVVRLKPKRFLAEHPDGNGGWTKGIDGIPRLPYNLPEILSSAPEMIYVAEGEKDAETLRGFGFVGTTNAFGANTNWTPEMAAYLVGRDVAVLADNDAAGLEHADKICAALHGTAKSVRLVWLTGLPPKGDVSDWFDANHTPKEFNEIIATTPLWEPPAPEHEKKNEKESTATPAPRPDAAAEKDLQLQPQNDYGNSQRLIEMYGSDIRYCTPMKKWFIWDGARWKLDEEDKIRELAQETMLEFARQSVIARNDALAKFAGQSLNSQRLASAIREAQPRLAVLPDELDRDPWLLNFTNGTVDLRSGEIREHRREDLITKIVHYKYDPNAECPRFLVFIERSTGPLVPYLKKAMGYSVTAVTSEKTNFLCLGPTDTGKSTFLGLFRYLFDEYSTLILIDALMQREEDNNSRADLADLRGVRFAMTSETEEGQRLREGKLKRITQGQGRIKSVRKYENPIEFNETHKLWIDANHKPIVKGSDSAIWNRLTPIPFDRPLTLPEIDRNLPATLREEAEGIIAWTVEGAQLWHQEGLSKPPEIEATRNKWRGEMDRLGTFRQECCVEDPNPACEAQARPLYQAYRKWAEEAGEKPMSETMFGLRMTEANFKKTHDSKNRAIYCGIALKDLFNA
jgi:putative DNA primase/helicase